MANTTAGYGKYRSDPYEDINSYLQVDEIVYYLQGMQSDVYKTAATLLNNHTKFIIIPESKSTIPIIYSQVMYLPTLQMLTELIRCKYDLTYNEAGHIFLHRKIRCKYDLTHIMKLGTYFYTGNYQYYLSEDNFNYDKFKHLYYYIILFMFAWLGPITVYRPSSCMHSILYITSS